MGRFFFSKFDAHRELALRRWDHFFLILFMCTKIKKELPRASRKIASTRSNLLIIHWPNQRDHSAITRRQVMVGKNSPCTCAPTSPSTPPYILGQLERYELLHTPWSVCTCWHQPQRQGETNNFLPFPHLCPLCWMLDNGFCCDKYYYDEWWVCNVSYYATYTDIW